MASDDSNPSFLYLISSAVRYAAVAYMPLSGVWLPPAIMAFLKSLFPHLEFSRDFVIVFIDDKCFQEILH